MKVGDGLRLNIPIAVRVELAHLSAVTDVDEAVLAETDDQIRFLIAYLAFRTATCNGVGEEATMAKHDAFGSTGRSGGVEDDPDIVGRCRRTG